MWTRVPGASGWSRPKTIATVDLLRAWCLVLGVWCLGCGVWGLVFGGWSLGFGVWGVWCEVWGVGCGVGGVGGGVDPGGPIISRASSRGITPLPGQQIGQQQ